jgi:glycosyltransferase involved in cell wall biosynthesis
MGAPAVSVVMSVYNGAARLAETLRSVLSQKGCDFEFIVVDDGSTDGSGDILDRWAAGDSRLRVIRQENTGLTRALIRGCAEARGEFIARQDAGDRALPGRLGVQRRFLLDHSDTVLVSCGARFVGPEGETLYVVARLGEELALGLDRLDVNEIMGPPHHGATMFRRDAYLEAGGYRDTFRVAQDLDLWLRLSERGRCWGLEPILYEARLEAHGIGIRRRDEQFRSAALAIECARLRRNGRDDAALLAGDHALTGAGSATPTRQQRSEFYYFLGSCLRSSAPETARRYFDRAVKENPLFLRAIVRRYLG